MNAREHRALAEQLLERLADEMKKGARNAGQVAAWQLVAARANAHAAIYLGDQFATEFDPDTSTDRLMADLRGDDDHDVVIAPVLNIPPRLRGER